MSESKPSSPFRPLCRAADRAIDACKMVCVEIEVDRLTGKCGRQILLRRQESETA